MSDAMPAATPLPGENLRVFPLPQFIRRAPFLAVFLVIAASNVAGSIVNFLYNYHLILRPLMDEGQRQVFWDVASVWYNAIAYPLCLGILVMALLPLRRCVRLLRAGVTPAPAFLERCRRGVINLPLVQVGLNLLGWLPGMFFFPWIVLTWGGPNNAAAIEQQFRISFLVSGLFTTAQTFFLLEAFLVEILYPALFQDARPAETRGVFRIPFGLRLAGLWLAVAVMPLVALWAAARQGPLADMAWGVLWVGILSGYAITWVLTRDLRRWILMHTAATSEVARENFDVRVRQKRPDEWGNLTDHFNDMAGALGRAQVMRETFGQVVSPEVRDELLERFPGLEVYQQEITVLFADIRGFTRRCATETPERIGALLNRFLTLAVAAIEGNGGLVNKFLGDGVMALFGATRVCDDHADRALGSAAALLVQLADLNAALVKDGEQPLAVGIGIHTGAALVGCFGATLPSVDGQVRIRKEFSAIGETVNLAQRLEQLTKQLGGPILISAATRQRLRQPPPLDDLGAHPVPGSPHHLSLSRVLS